MQRRIDAQATFDYVWGQMTFLKGQKNIELLLNKAIDSNFYGIDIESIITQRTESEVKDCLRGAPKCFITENEVQDTAEKVVISIKQAEEYYRAANSVGLLTKPVLLYYGMVSLSKALVDSTYCVPSPEKSHGLNITYEGDLPNLEVKINRYGAYQTFRDSYINDTFLYTNRENTFKFNLKELLSLIPGIAVEWKLAYEEIPQQPTQSKTVGIDDPKENAIKKAKYNFEVLDHDVIKNQKLNQKFVHLIDIHFLTMFILCTYARYKPLEWKRIIDGFETSEMLVINSFLTRSSLDFPMLIYSEITGIYTFFSPFAKMIGRSSDI